MKKCSRFLALVLALVMVAAMFAACGSNEEPNSTTAGADGTPKVTDTGSDATTPDATTPTPDTTTESGIDVSGYNFTIVGNGDVFPEENEDGTYKNQLEEELADKLAELEARLDITIEKMDYASDNRLELVTSAALGGIKIADLLWLRHTDFWPAAKDNMLLPLDDERLVKEGLNYTDETRWYQPAMKWSEMFGHQWTLNVASEYVAVPTGYFVCFNKELCASAGYDDMYQLVRDKKWTWDVYRDIARKTTKDVDGDGTPDIWGTGATAWGNEAVSNGAQFIGQVDGKWQLTINSDAGVRALQFLYDMNYGDKTRWDVGSGECRQAFADGTITFNWAQMGHINGPGEVIFNSEHDYGIIPMPMGPDATEYYSMAGDLDAFVIQSANQDLDKVVPILNEWALILNDTESYLSLLDDGRCRTEEDKAMLIDYVIPNFALNMGNICHGAKELVDEGIISGVSYHGLTPQQAIETYEAKVNAALDAFFGQ
ncbi:MAG: hypothetical protein DBY36_04015 [Clostridiales bacterium]|nr:MAG: hypothetical protein DBY36_04015 [Clostridiales bacterium]